MKGKDLVKLLEKKGFRVVRIRKSHHVMKKGGKTVSVPIHNTDMRKGTLHTILKAAGLEEEAL